MEFASATHAGVAEAIAHELGRFLGDLPMPGDGATRAAAPIAPRVVCYSGAM